ncbi:hypothetical protein Patl1_20007 [Pistacia atlantica]|uniref:Uncharacterized protein n=1 Tax=Pistacia atlantica TaxID=434234 RepID=A0ACC1BHJ0_9ROSI|nr:hypothetical protein Patl1_20007 [Pistacia atlantica]
MDPHSAPGPDEFSGAFFQGCWDIIKAEVIQFVQYFFQHTWLPPNLNSNLITLIPKVASADSVNQFRPKLAQVSHSWEKQARVIH